ncbi:GerMN domain-containing protein [Acetivibrio clariflavus]|uniref:GerMN domain-containing protein n=1 Tax=Acetivibrio clariflavus TaxID=288965 RepID=UPI0031F5527B
MHRQLCVIIACIFIISIFAGCSVFQKIGDNDEVSPASSIALSEAEARQIADKSPVSLYFANEEGTKLKLEIRYVPMDELKKPVEEIASLIVRELINGPSKGSTLKPTIPEGTKLRSVKISGDVATVDFSKEFKENHPGGKAAEQLTIYSVVNSLTELKEISQVKFKIEGKTSKEFKGAFKFDNAFPRSTSLISKETTNLAKPDTSEESKKDKSETEKDNKGDKDAKETMSDQDSTDEIEVFEEHEYSPVSEIIDVDGEEGKTTFYFEDEPIEEELLE